MWFHVHIIVKLIYNLNLLFLPDKNMNKVNVNDWKLNS